ncbi:MAG: hypothetical protein IIA40_12295 [SAR324 cluster bacterium]|nr:hypothetical protein [SAR324 cluster bacterium]
MAATQFAADTPLLVTGILAAVLVEWLKTPQEVTLIVIVMLAGIMSSR